MDQIQIDEGRIRNHVGNMVRGAVEKPCWTPSHCELDYALPDMHRQEIRTNKSARADHERDSEIHQRTRVVGAFPGAQPYLDLAAARLRYRTGTAWSAKCHMKMRPPLSAAGHANRSRRFTALPRHLADTIVCCGRPTHRQLRIVRPSSDRRTGVLFAISV
jgi:hypothetical protein